MNQQDGKRRRGWPWLVAGLVAAGFVAAAVLVAPRKPSARYLETVRTFYTGVAALDAGDKDRALRNLSEATRLSPQEPAAWANLALAQMQLGQFDQARQSLEQAEQLAPDAASIQVLWSALESGLGRPEAALPRLERAVQLDPDNPRTVFALAELLLREDAEANRQRVIQLTDHLLQRHPENLLLLLQRLELAAADGDRQQVETLLESLSSRAEFWPAAARQQLAALRTALDQEPWQAASIRELRFLRNVLKQTQDFKAAISQVVTPVKQVGEPLYQFLRLPAPPFTAAEADVRMTFEPIRGAGNAPPGPSGFDLLLAPGIGPRGDPLPVAANPTTVVQVRSGEVLFTVSQAPPPAASPTASPTRPPAATPASPPASLSRHGLLLADWDRDYRLDLVLATAEGIRLAKATDAGTFQDVTDQTGLAAELLATASYGVWPWDLELDGDLDLLVAPWTGPPRVLRNAGDGTFAEQPLFEQVRNPRAFCWADFDRDGDPDVALLDDQGRLHLFDNRRSGWFVPRAAPPDLPPLTAVSIGDIDADGRLDLVLSDAGTQLFRLTTDTDSGPWQVQSLTEGDSPSAAGTLTPADSFDQVPAAGLWVVDLDNNGALDVVLSRGLQTWIWLNHGPDRLRPLAGSPWPIRTTDVEDVAGDASDAPGNAPDGPGDRADARGDGRLDLLGVAADGTPQILANRGTRDYHWQVIRPRALQKAESSDSRMNSFALGAEIQVRSGMLVQKRVVQRPRVHFGLGIHPRTDVARIVWPHGAAQGEFDLAADAEVLAEQRLIGSCPFLFAFDGTQMRFVTDFLWRSPLGLRINAQDTAGIVQTEDWVKVDGGLLAPRDGLYDLRITADLWETHFFDHVSLLVVDHPAEFEVFVDERFCFPPPALEVLATTPPRPFAGVRDQRGRDVTETVRLRDRQYVDGFPLGMYQGVTSEHWVEITLGPEASSGPATGSPGAGNPGAGNPGAGEAGSDGNAADGNAADGNAADGEIPAAGPLLLVASGFVYPTDSSINVALSQGRADPPHGIILEVPDGADGWKAVSGDLGFPSGKDKTVVIELPREVLAHPQQRFRLRTNLEIYWDQLAWAVKRPDVELRTQRLAPRRADLVPRGISRMHQASRKSPELPAYEQPLPAAGYWRDLVGYYTRFGDVRELLEAVEDRYVIMNAGDELRLEFAELPPPPDGWKRDFVLIGDGWVKDGNLNTAFSRTVLPLPTHSNADYDRPPTSLEDDPVFRRYPEDWRIWHTRYITADDFSRGLRPLGFPAGRE